MAGTTVLIDELLCYISSKLNITPCDDLVSLCASAFTDTAIAASKLCLFNSAKRGPGDPTPNSGMKYRKCRGDNRVDNDLKDIIGLFNELGDEAPKFAAVDLNIFPLPAIDKVDVNSLLLAIQSLSRDVSALTKVVGTQQETISSLQKLIAEKALPNITYANATANTGQPRGCTAQINLNSGQTQMVPPVVRYQRAPANTGDEVNSKRRKRQMNVGQKPSDVSDSNDKLCGIKRIKSAQLFVTRLSPDCEEDDLRAFISANLNLEAEITKIDNSKRHTSFSSFHISCVCDDPKVFYDPKLWPEHVLYRRWYPPRKPREVDDNIGGNTVNTGNP